MYNRNCLINLIFIAVLLTVSPAAAQAKPPSSAPQSIINSIVKISGPELCGTAFLLAPNRLVTAGHLIRGACQEQRCQNLKLFKSAGIGQSALQELRYDSLVLKHELPAFDLAVFELSSQQITDQPIQIRPGPVTTEQVSVIGFPSCQELQIANGVVENSNNLYISSTASGLHGNSGSPLFDSEYNLLGVVVDTRSIWQAVLALSFGRHAKLRAVPAEHLTKIVGLTDETIFLEQLQALFSFYQESVSNQIGGQRLSAGLDFIMITERIKQWLPRSPLDLNSYRPLLRAEAVLFSPPLSGEFSRLSQPFEMAELIAIAYSLESRGFLGPNLNLVQFDQWLLELKKTPRSAAHINQVEKTLESAKQQGYLGFFINAAARLIWLVLLALLVVLAWSWSLGHVFATAPGSIVRRLTIMLLVAVILWPLSYLLFLLKGKNT